MKKLLALMLLLMIIATLISDRYDTVTGLFFAFGTLVGELVEGIGLPAPFIDFIITFFISALTYRLWYTTFNRGKKDTPRFNSTYNTIHKRRFCYEQL
mgnify:CR=1 FL=1